MGTKDEEQVSSELSTLDSQLPTVVRVVLVPPMGRLSTLDYRVPVELGRPQAGLRVLVPLGPRRCMGVVTELVSGTPHHEKLRDVIAVLEEQPALSGSLLDLARWMADYYLAPLGEVVATLLPGSLRVETDQEVIATGGAERDGYLGERARGLLAALERDGPQSLRLLRQRWGDGVTQTISRLRRRGAVRVIERVRREVPPTRHARIYEAITPPADAGLEVSLGRRPAVRELYWYLRRHPLRRAAAAELRTVFSNAAAKLKTLQAAGLARYHDEEHYRPVLPPVVVADCPVTLTAAQHAGVEAIGTAFAAGFAPFLLWGVTGSGKTEVYLRIVALALERQRTALILVPEISLTHQLVDRVRARFGERVAVLHSDLGVGERWDEWRRLARGEAAIAIGARSAVFAPLRRLGVIVVDEEHDAAYKQADGVRYHGRDVAVVRAKLEGCPIVLGSATPSMESFHNAQTGRYRLLALAERVEARPLPPVRLVDLRTLERRTPTPFSPELAAALDANLAAGAQSLVFLNRRGFANFLQCQACGDPLMCPNCSVTLTWHRRLRAVRCHYCAYTITAPEQCATCGERALHGWGVGTEQVEALLRERFPGARVARMDRDTTQRKGSQAALVRAWAGGKLDILVGTQMITKGHDVPGVTLVGVLLADLSLSFPDFRAAERTFQLLAQVAGRAGRGEQPGRVIVQTLQPEHYSLRAAAAHDFATFAKQEMNARRELGYPPFARLILVRAEGEDRAAVQGVAGELATHLCASSAGRFTVLGPAPAPLERLRQRHRWQLLLRGRQATAMRRAVATAVDENLHVARGRAVRVVVDVDPQGML